MQSRKYNPKQTYETILSASTKLFLEKGFDKTSMQDIVEAIGMSKGAIFHHFNSKEEILNAVIQQQSESAEMMLNRWLIDNKKLTAKEKLKGILEINLSELRVHSLDGVFSSQVQNPQFILANMQHCVNKIAPIFAKIMREGIKEGSITTEFPDECAEVFFLLFSIWCDPEIFECDITRLGMRIKFLQKLMISMGADIISDQILNDYLQFITALYQKNKQ